MALDGQNAAMQTENYIVMPDLLATTQQALESLDTLFEAAKGTVKSLVSKDGRVSSGLMEQHQAAAHGLSWLATYHESMRQMQNWATKLNDAGEFGEAEQLLHQIACGEYHAQIVGGIPMSQGEIVRLSDMKIPAAAQQDYQDAAVMNVIANGNTQAARTRLVELMQDQAGNVIFGAAGLDEELEMIREQFRRFSVDKVEPHAHEWHLNDELIPMEIIEELAELGVFGLTIPEELGGFGLTKASMAVVSEELSRGYIGVGSLGTRSEIAAELIICGGTDEQKENWLPKLASGEILPTAVFTEPNTGSDLGALRTRAVKDESGDYKITGNKTWITHAARTHVMTLLRVQTLTAQITADYQCSWLKRHQARTKHPSQPKG